MVFSFKELRHEVPAEELVVDDRQDDNEHDIETVKETTHVSNPVETTVDLPFNCVQIQVHFIARYPVHPVLVFIWTLSGLNDLEDHLFFLGQHAELEHVGVLEGELRVSDLVGHLDTLGRTDGVPSQNRLESHSFILEPVLVESFLIR